MVLTVIALVVGVGLAAVGGAMYMAVRDVGAARQVVSDYFTALQERRYDDAYRALCPDTRASHPREAFEPAVDARPPVAHEPTGELSLNRMPWRTTSTVGVNVTYADGTSDARTVSLVRSDGTWLVCGSPY